MSQQYQSKDNSTSENNEFATFRPSGFESNFTIIANSAAQDPHLSFSSKGLLFYLLSLPKTWRINRNHLATVYKGDIQCNGKSAIDRMMTELIEKKYIVYKKEKDAEGRWLHFYEVNPIPVDSYSEIKKIFPEPDNPALDNRPLLERNKEERNKEKKIKKKKETSPDAGLLNSFLFEKIKSIDSKAPKPNLAKWEEEFDKILRIDRRDINEVKRVITWCFEQPSYWPSIASSPQKLRRNFSEAYISMTKEKQKPAKEREKAYDEKIDRLKANKAWARTLCASLSPDILKKISLEDYLIRITTQNGIIPIGYSEHGFQEQVTNILRKMNDSILQSL